MFFLSVIVPQTLKINLMLLSLHAQLANEQDIASEMEATINRKIAEHEQVEAQIQTEHDEEVQALHQQKQQLARQLDDIKLCYSQSLKEQDKHVRLIARYSLYLHSS